MATHTITSTEAQDVTLEKNGLKLSDAIQDSFGSLHIYEAEGDDWVQYHTILQDGTYMIDHADIDMDGWRDVTNEEDSE
jgi:hypothetical protein